MVSEAAAPATDLGRARPRAWVASPRWLLMSVGVVLTLAVLDLSLGDDVSFSGTLVVGPFLAGAVLGPMATSTVGAIGLGLTLALARWDESGMAETTVRVTVLLGGTVLASWVAARREAREQALVDLARVADVAQRAVLHTVPSELGSVAFACRYLSASREALIGGDFYEVATFHDRVRVVVGDVRGKGLEAVRLAAVVLGAFREAAESAEQLEEVALVMDRRLRRHLEPEDFVTAILAEFSPDGRLTIVNCGHHPPLHVGRAGFQLLSVQAPTTPLGLDPTPEAVVADLAAGDRLLLYTDGLVEARSGSGRMVSLERLIDTLSEPNLDAALSGLVTTLEHLTVGPLEDDLALVLAEYRGA